MGKKKSRSARRRRKDLWWRNEDEQIRRAIEEADTATDDDLYDPDFDEEFSEDMELLYEPHPEEDEDD